VLLLARLMEEGGIHMHFDVQLGMQSRKAECSRVKEMKYAIKLLKNQI